jgi:hypothetical protein
MKNGFNPAWMAEFESIYPDESEKPLDIAFAALIHADENWMTNVSFLPLVEMVWYLFRY